jgi:glutamate-1-semialdehyde 2,1-aminomutase
LLTYIPDSPVLDQSKILFERAKKIIPSGVNSAVRFYDPYPFFVSSGKNSRIRTVGNKTLVDYCMGYGSVLLGHAYEPIIESVKSQLDKGTLFCIPTEKEVQLAEIISSVIPHAEMVRLVNTGSEATMNAIRLARAFTKRKKIIKFDGCYHGTYDYVLVNSSHDEVLGIPSSDGSLSEAALQTQVVPYNNFNELEKTITKNQDEIACVIIEPIFANMGLIPPEKGYLDKIRKITKEKDIVLIFDEVITGFRLAPGGASELFGIKPDLATFGKAMSNGFPIAAIAGKKEIMQQLAPSGKVYQASTFAGNPISVSASIATIEAISQQRDKIYPQISGTCRYIVDGIRSEIDKLELNYVVNSIGSMFQLFFTSGKVRDAKSAQGSDVKLFRLLYDELLKRGVFIPPSQFETCFISFSHDKDDIDKTIEAYANALGTVTTRIRHL